MAKKKLVKYQHLGWVDNFHEQVAASNALLLIALKVHPASLIAGG